MTITINPLISILIPAYKKDFLKDAIQSVVNQDYDKWECIIVNGASPFDIDSVLNEFCDSRIKYYINEKNCGAENVVDNWNICLSKAKGDFVVCMGDDDMLLPSCLSQYVALINKYPSLDIYHARTLIIDEQNNINSVQEARPEYETLYSYIYNNVFIGRRQFIGDYLFRTQSLMYNGGFLALSKGWISDELSCYQAARIRGIANTQNFGFCYRENSQTITSGIDVPTKLNNRRIKVAWILNTLKDAKTDSLIESYYIRIIKNRVIEWERNLMKSEIESDILKNGFHRVSYWKDFQIDSVNNIRDIHKKHYKIDENVKLQKLTNREFSKIVLKVVVKKFLKNFL